MRPIFNKTEAKKEMKKNPEIYLLIKDFPYSRPDGEGFRSNQLFVCDGNMRIPWRDDYHTFNDEYIIDKISGCVGCIKDGFFNDLDNKGIRFYKNDNYLIMDLPNLGGIYRFVIPFEKTYLILTMLRNMVKRINEQKFPFDTARIPHGCMASINLISNLYMIIERYYNIYKVKKLREELVCYSLMDCKKALQECNYDLRKAHKWIKNNPPSIIRGI